MFNFSRKGLDNNKKGFTLIELAFVIGLFALIIVLVLYFYNRTKLAAQINSATETSLFVVAGVENWKGASPDFIGLTYAALQQQGKIPDNIRPNDQTNPTEGFLPGWDGCTNGSLTINPTDNDRTATLTFSNVSYKICTALAQRIDQTDSSFVVESQCPSQPTSGCNATYTLKIS